MCKRHQIIAVILLAAALAADRIATTAAPVLRPQIAQTARRLSSRLTRNLRQIIPATALRQQRHEFSAGIERDEVAVNQAHIHRMPMPSYWFRLPPPLV